MDLVPSAALPSLLGAAKWRKSSHSNPSGNCVEIARLPGRRVAVRDSRRPDGPALLFSQSAWQEFLHDLREGGGAGDLVRWPGGCRGAVSRPGRRLVGLKALRPSGAEIIP